MRVLAHSLATLILATTLATPATSRAGEPPREASTPPAPDRPDVEAQRLFARGSRAYLAGRYADALTDLKGSYTLVPSPNSELLVARSLRELGRLVEAAETFSHVEHDAKRRVQEGDARYAPTADAAANEGAAVRAKLGRVRLRVIHVQPGTRLTIDGDPVALAEAEDTVVLHAPGEARVRLIPVEGAEQSQSTTVVAGTEVRMTFDLRPADSSPPPAMPPPSPPPIDRPPPPASDGPPGWAAPAALVSGGVAVAGLGVFTGFGLASNAKYAELRDRCGGAGCGPADRAEADTGKTYQTIANVGLGVAITAAVATGIFTILALQHPSARSASTQRSRFVGGVGSAGLELAIP